MLNALPSNTKPIIACLRLTLFNSNNSRAFKVVLMSGDDSRSNVLRQIIVSVTQGEGNLDLRLPQSM